MVHRFSGRIGIYVVLKERCQLAPCTEISVMKIYACVFILFYLLATGSTQPRLGRPHPLYSQAQQPNAELLLTALLFGLDLNELLTLQATGGMGLGVGRGAGSRGQPTNPWASQTNTLDMNALSLLGIIDAPDVPDAPAGGRGQGQRGGRNRGRGKGSGAGAEGAAEGPRRRGPRRRGPKKAGGARQ